MLRSTIKNQISEKDQLVLQTNHNFFIRTAIANVAKIIIATVILVGVIVLLSIIMTEEAKNVTTSSDLSKLTPFYIFMILSYLVYLAYFIATVSEIVTLYKKSNQVENKILGTFGQVKTASKPIVASKTTIDEYKNDEDL